jgi:hypothetical protein
MSQSTKSKKLIRGFPCACVCVITLAVVIPIPAAQEPASVEQGKFVLHKFEQAIGQETYEIHRDGDSLEAKIDFKFTDRGRAVPLSATFRSAADLTPQDFEIKGSTSRLTTIDEAVTIDSGKVHFRTRDKQSDFALPSGPLFTIAGYAPSTMQMLMVRYWATHGCPHSSPRFPAVR